MIKFSLAEAANILKINQPVSDVGFCGVSIDTRTLSPGNLFVAIPGERVDGHDFIDAAQQKGASAALVTRKVNSSLPQLVVEDITIALGKLAAAWRDQFTIPFVAVTGSNGKTTLKNMVAAILKEACHGDESQVLATKGTLNNHLGLPLTLARLNANHRYAVIEMGMNHFGEIDYLTRLTRPNVAVITNAAACHLEGVGDLAGVARAKAEIFHGLQAGGTAILNRNDAFFSYWSEQANAFSILSFGLDDNKNSDDNFDLDLPLLGRHNILNALAATAAGIALNIDLDTIKAGLKNMAPAPGRMELHQLANNVKLIDDTYNANPFSLQAAIDTLATFDGNKILVLGDMRELGQDAALIHHKAGENIRAAGIHTLFTYGDLTKNTASAFGENAYHFTEHNQLVDALQPLLAQQTTVLVKGSRSMHMEKVIKSLLQTQGH